MCDHAFFILKIVGGVGSNFGGVFYCTAAFDFLLSCFLFCFCSSIEQYVRVTGCTGRTHEGRGLRTVEGQLFCR